MRQVITTRRTPRTYRPELALCRGPLTLAQPGAGTFADLYGAAWALALHKREGPTLYQIEAGAWVERHDPDAVGVLAARGVRHAALAFDQAARPVIAWEQGGAVYVRQWDGLAGQYVTRGPWPGRDPLLYPDALPMGRTDTSDVLLLHIDGAQVVARVQREIYDAAHPLAAVPEGTVLDQVASAGLGFVLCGETPDGARLYLHSQAYPVTFATVISTSQVVTGELYDMQISASATNSLAASLTLTGTLSTVSALLTYSDTLAASQTIIGALSTVVLASATSDTLTSSQAITGALSTVVLAAAITDTLTTSQTLTGAFS